MEGWHFAQQNDGVVFYHKPKTTPPLRGTASPARVSEGGELRCRSANGILPFVSMDCSLYEGIPNPVRVL
jgi:hypothetical protein